MPLPGLRRLLLPACITLAFPACASTVRHSSPGGAAAPAWTQTDDGALLLVYEQRDAGASDIYFCRVKPDADLEGAPRIRLDADEPGAAESIEPRIAANANGLVVVVWQDLRGGTPHIRARRSTDGGHTWPGEELVVSDPSGESFPATMPSVVINADGNMWVAWEDRRDGARDVFIRRSLDGVFWEASQRAETDAPGAASSFHPQLLSLLDDTLLLVWWDDRNGLADLYVRRSTDRGVSWASPEQRLDPGTPGAVRSHGARIRADAGRVTVSWEEGSERLARTVFGDEDSGRLARSSTDAGATWSAQELSNESSDPPPATRVEVFPQGGLRILRAPRPGSPPEK